MMPSFRSARRRRTNLSQCGRAAQVEAMEVRTLLSAVLVKDINPGPSSSVPQHGVDVNGELYFSADDGTHGFEVWKSNGTTAGTSLLKDINLTPNSAGEPFDLTNVNGTLYFVEDLAQLGLGHDFKLFRSNGTAAGTVAITDLQLLPQGNFTFYDPQLTSDGGALYFYDGNSVYKTDPSTTTITPVSGASAGVPGTLLTFGGKVLLDSAAGQSAETEMQVLNGGGFVTPGAVTTPASTGVGGVGEAPAADVLNGLLYYLAAVPVPGSTDGSTQPALYRTDGTQAGTLAVRQFPGDHFSESPFDSIPPDKSELYAAGGKLLFNLRSGLWVSDGTSTEPTLLSPKLQLDLRPVQLNGTTYFIAHDRTNNYVKQLWKTAGTVAGTVLLMDNIADDVHDAQLTTFDGLLYFTAPNGQMLWQSDGTPQGTQPVPGVSYQTNANANETFILPQSGGKLYFAPTVPQFGLELWKIDPAVTLPPLVIHGTSQDDTITVSVAAGGILKVNVNGTETDYTPAQYAGGITIDSGGSDSAGDSLTLLGLPAVRATATGEGMLKATVGSNARGLQDIVATSLTLGGATGTLQVTVNDSSDATARHLTLGTAADSGVTYDSLQGLTPGVIQAAASLLVINLGSAGNTIDVNGTAAVPTGFAVLNLNTGNGDDTVRVSATGTGTILNINGQSGHDVVNVGGDDGTVANIQGVVNVSNPLGGSDLTVDDSSVLPNGRPVAATLSTFQAQGTTYGSLTGLASVPINFAGSGLRILDVKLSQVNVSSLTVQNTPGGGPMTFEGLSSAVVEGVAAGQSLILHASEAFTGIVTIDFSTGRIGDGSTILADCIDLIIDGASTSDQFVIDGGIHHGHTVVRFDSSVLDRVSLQTGSFAVTTNLNGEGAYELVANGQTTRLTYEADQLQSNVSLEIHNGAIVTLANGVSVDFPPPFTLLGFIPDGIFDIGTGQAYLSYSGTDVAHRVRTQIVSGLSGGRGITSDAADSIHTVGFIATDLGNGVTEVHVKWTVKGDANLDGVVDFADLLTVAQNYGRTDATWQQGDFNYDGTVDFADLLKLGQDYGNGVAAATPLAAPYASDLASLKNARGARPRVAKQ